LSALLDQFIAESRDLLEAAGGALLTLETTPADVRAINDLFRSVHTLKGASGLFDFPALTKLVHVGEDLLDGVREGTIPVTAELVDVQLAVLDQLGSWIDAVAADGRLPDDAQSVSHDLIERLAAFKSPSVAAGAAPASLPASAGAAAGISVARCTWLDTLDDDARRAAFRQALDDGQAIVALDYTPDADCYFRGEDPLLTFRSLPDLLALGVRPTGPKTPLQEFDPYQCRLGFRALCAAPRAEVEHLFRYVGDQIQIFEIKPEELILPVGADTADAACQGFAAAAPAWISARKFADVRAAAQALLAAVAANGRPASALRWLLAILDSAENRTDWLVRLAAAVGGAAVDWSVSAPGEMSAVVVPVGEMARRVVAEQRKILALPTEDAGVLAGRIASVGSTLAKVAAAYGARDAERTFEAATAIALRRADPGRLIEAITAWFGASSVDASATAGRPVSVTLNPLHAAPAHQIQTLKVDRAKVDLLMALIGELVVAKNALPFLSRRAENVYGSRELGREIGQRYGVLDRLAQEMQEAIMEVRLLPVSEVFQRFPRLIRDISRKLGKQIKLVVEGEETRADKNIIEILGEPLIHIVRNSADHGIEMPPARLALGKPAVGTIRLKALQDGDNVVIEISDDGRGVDTARVIQKALERGLIEPGAAARMSPAEAANLIFLPGLSTVETVTDLSGRGVGMDVVQTSIREAGGTVTVSSQPHIGTLIRLALPLSMAVLRVMTVETAGVVYGVPINLIAETVRVDAVGIRKIKDAEAFLLRDTIVPLVRLRSLLHLPALDAERDAVLVLRTPAGLVGLIVDRFDEHIDIILKPLEGILAGLRGFAGTALLGDGRVLMILDIEELL
jgi:two-component system chemotaxis sensor kinase CheA